MVRLDSRGFGAVEAIVATPVLAIAIAGVLAAIYLCIAQAWLADAAEESALCVAEKVHEAECRRELESKTSTVLPIGEYTTLSIVSYGQRIVVRYAYRALGIELENQIALQLPVTKPAVGL